MEKPISGYSIRLNWIKAELLKDICICKNNDEINVLAGTYLMALLSVSRKKI